MPLTSMQENTWCAYKEDPGLEEFEDDDNPGKGKNFENTTLKSSSSISPDGHSVLNPRYNFRSVFGENL